MCTLKKKLFNEAFNSIYTDLLVGKGAWLKTKLSIISVQ